MENFQATPEELITIIGKQQVILEKQAKALNEIAGMYNKLMEENQQLKMILNEKGESDGRLGEAGIN